MYWYKPNLQRHATDSYGVLLANNKDCVKVDDISEANLEGSEQPNGYHIIQLDLDIPHEYVPSSTKGHGHLIIRGHPLKWADYLGLLAVLAKAGIVEDNYLEMSRKSGQTYLRVPGVTKDNPIPLGQRNTTSLVEELEKLREVDFTGAS